MVIGYVTYVVLKLKLLGGFSSELFLEFHSKFIPKLLTNSIKGQSEQTKQ